MNTGKRSVLALNHHSLVENHSLSSGLISANLGASPMEVSYERPIRLCQEQSTLIILKLVIRFSSVVSFMTIKQPSVLVITRSYSM